MQLKLKLKTRKKTQRDKISTGEEDKNNKNTSKANAPEIRHFKLHHEILEDKKLEHKLKGEQQTEKQQQIKKNETENKK